MFHRKYFFNEKNVFWEGISIFVRISTCLLFLRSRVYFCRREIFSKEIVLHQRFVAYFWKPTENPSTPDHIFLPASFLLFWTTWEWLTLSATERGWLSNLPNTFSKPMGRPANNSQPTGHLMHPNPTDKCQTKVGAELYQAQNYWVENWR